MDNKLKAHHGNAMTIFREEILSPDAVTFPG
jgi:hypothetical protein